MDGPWYGAVATLTAAATATSRIELGPLVASPNFRHPVSLRARDVATRVLPELISRRVSPE